MISREDVDKLANLARLELDETQKDSLVKDLGNILGYIDLLKEAEDADKIEAVNHVAPNVMRADKETNKIGELGAKLVEAAPKHDEKCEYVKVKKIL